jgi:hypothetical protein
MDGTRRDQAEILGGGGYRQSASWVTPRFWGDTTMDNIRSKMEVPVTGRLQAESFRSLQKWCTSSMRKRSEVIGLVLERVLEIYEHQEGADQPLEQFIRRLRLDPPP